jgi:ABC-type Mn2+/Zn2+ transport system permease subunit
LVVVSILVVVAAAARTLLTRNARIFVGSRLFGGRSDILTIFFLVQLKDIEKQM